MGRGARQEGETAAGRVLAGRYELRELIGIGAAAHVYLARDNHLGRDVAVKMLTEAAAADPDFAERFRREAKAIASFSHPNIVTIFDWGTVDNLDYMVMEYVPGGSVSELLAQQGRLPEDRALSLAQGTARALAAAHARGIVHRDIKPDNILLADDGSPKVADFGIAWVPGLSHLTLTNAIFGTVSYISPEQARGEAVDGRSDLYSLGVVLYRMLAGRLPFEGGSMVDVAVRHVQEEPQPPRSIRPDISPQAERIVLKAMAKRPADRYQSAAAMAEALEAERVARAARAPKPVGTRRPRTESTVAAPLGVVRETVPRRQINRPVRTTSSSPWTRFLWAVPAALLALVVVAVALAAHPWTSSSSHRAATAGHGTTKPTPRPVHTAAPAGSAPGKQHGGTTSSHSTPQPNPAATHPVSAPPPVTHPDGAPPAHHPTSVPPAAAQPTSAPPVAAAPPVPQPAAPPASSGSSSSSASVGASTPQAAVIAFYTDVANHRFADAARLWSPSLQQSDPPGVYINQRFAQTQALWVNGVSLQGSDASGTATVSVHVTETVGPLGTKQVFDGSWHLVQQNGQWLLDSPDLHSVSSADMVSPWSISVPGMGNGKGKGKGKGKGRAKHGED